MNKRITRQVEWVQSFRHFRHARKILEVGSGNFETLSFLAEKYPEKHFVGVDFEFSDLAAEAVKKAPRNLTAMKHDIRDLSLLSNAQFDFAFSAAVLEHIREFEAHLLTVHAALREGGKYSFSENPFWSSSHGHHYEHNAPDCPVPHYGHLMMSREELKTYLAATAKKEDPEISKILRIIYEREDLSRLTRTETRAIVAASPFTIELWKEKLDKNYTEDAMKAVLENNVYNVDARDLRVSGVTCTLSKPPASDGKQSWPDKLLRKIGILR